LWERAGYLRRGLPDRVALVDEALAALGHVVEAPKTGRGAPVDGSGRRNAKG
jgi:hypothetical protein